MPTRRTRLYTTHRFIRTAALILSGGLLGGCATSSVVVPDIGLAAPLTRFSIQGPYEYNIERGELRGVSRCVTYFDTYRPEGVRGEVMIILTHGFMSTKESMKEWASLWASHGLSATVVSTCNSSWLNGNQRKNASDLIAVAKLLNSKHTVYAGFSSGGLSALIASRDDPHSIGFLGLDPVDTKDLATAALDGISIPSLVIVGESSSCNARNNFLGLATDYLGVSVVRAVNATHCHFENPFNESCGRICGSVTPLSASNHILESIRSLATTWLINNFGGDQQELFWQSLVDDNPKIFEELQ